MSADSEDALYRIFEEHLHSGLYDDVALDRFIHDVVELYWIHLSQIGHVPWHLHEALKVDLIQDVHDMLKLKIYGHYGIGEYNRARRKKSKSG